MWLAVFVFRHGFSFLSLSNILILTSTLSIRNILIWTSTMNSIQFLTHSLWVQFPHLIWRCQLVTLKNTHKVTTWKKNNCISIYLKLNAIIYYLIDNAIPIRRLLLLTYRLMFRWMDSIDSIEIITTIQISPCLS